MTVLALVCADGDLRRGRSDRALLGRGELLLVVHWLGDSLDGTLARVRKAERPTYGYYLDHLADAVATAVIGLGLGPLAVPAAPRPAW